MAALRRIIQAFRAARLLLSGGQHSRALVWKLALFNAVAEARRGLRPH